MANKERMEILLSRKDVDDILRLTRQRRSERQNKRGRRWDSFYKEMRRLDRIEKSILKQAKKLERSLKTS